MERSTRAEGTTSVSCMMKDKLCKVDEGRSQALRRLLAGERMLARKNFNSKVQDCIDKGYLVEPKDLKGDLEGVMKSATCFQPY